MYVFAIYVRFLCHRFLPVQVTVWELSGKSPAEIKAAYRSASLVGNDRVVFNIGGNKYRLVVRVNYAYGVIYIRFVGTHRQYNRINVKEV